MDPFGSSAELHLLGRPGHISSAHRARKDGARVGMKVTAHQEKEKNEKTRRAREGQEKRERKTR